MRACSPRRPCCVRSRRVSHAGVCGAGTGSLEAMLMESFLVKWGKQTGSVAMPAVAAGGVESVQMDITCYVRKVVR